MQAKCTAHRVRAVGLASQEPSVSPGHRNHPAREHDPLAWEHAQFYCSRYVDREGVGRAGVANGGYARPKVQGGAMNAAQRRQGAPLAPDQLVRLGGSVPDEVDVGVDQTGQ